MDVNRDNPVCRQACEQARQEEPIEKLRVIQAHLFETRRERYPADCGKQCTHTTSLTVLPPNDPVRHHKLVDVAPYGSARLGSVDAAVATDLWTDEDGSLNTHMLHTHDRRRRGPSGNARLPSLRAITWSS